MTNENWPTTFHLSKKQNLSYVKFALMDGSLKKLSQSDELGKLALRPFVPAFLELLCSLTK